MSLVVIVMTMVKHGFQAWALQKADEDLLDGFQGNCPRIFLGTRLIDYISKSRLYEKCGSSPLFRAIIKETLEWLGFFLRMKDDRMPKIVLFGKRSRDNREAGLPWLELKDVIRKDLKEMETSWEGVKMGALNKLEGRRDVRSCVGLRWLGAELSC